MRVRMDSRSESSPSSAPMTPRFSPLLMWSDTSVSRFSNYWLSDAAFSKRRLRIVSVGVDGRFIGGFSIVVFSGLGCFHLFPNPSVEGLDCLSLGWQFDM